MSLKGSEVSPKQRAGNPENSISEKTMHSLLLPPLYFENAHARLLPSPQATANAALCSQLVRKSRLGASTSVSRRPSYPTVAQGEEK